MYGMQIFRKADIIEPRTLGHDRSLIDTRKLNFALNELFINGWVVVSQELGHI